MQCLNLKVTYACTNSCTFCFSNARATVGNRSYDELAKQIREGLTRGCRHLVLSGGEPTLFRELPHLICEAVAAGFSRITIQSNGIGFASKNYAEGVIRAAKGAQLTVVLSLHGNDQGLHDFHTGRIGSFDEVMRTFHNLRGHCTLFTNSVVTKVNIDHLSEILDVALANEVSTSQFSILHVAKLSNETLRPAFIEAADAIRRVCGRVIPISIRSEGVPFCLMKGVESGVGEAYWPLHLDLSNGPDQYLSGLDQLASGQRSKLPACTACLADEVCWGVWRECAEEFRDAFPGPIPRT